MKIGMKIILLSAGLVAATALSILTVMYVQQQDLDATLSTSLDAQIEKEIRAANNDVLSLLHTQNDTLLLQLDGYLNVARRMLQERGAPALGENMVEWTAINQINKESSTVRLPALQAGDLWLGQNYEFASSTPVVDEFMDLTQTTCTVFQRMNEAGDMLRVATNIAKLDGKRAVGTYIPSSSPVAQTLVSGKTFRGKAFVVNDWYLTVYEPIKDAGGAVIGALYVGVRQTGVKALINAITNRTVGKSGSVTIIGAAGRDAGKVLVSKDAERIGTMVTDITATDGRSIYQDIISQGSEAGEDSPAVIRYALNENGSEHRYIGATSRFQAWDWIIYSSAPEAEFMETRTKVHAALTTMQFWILTLSAVIVLVGLVVGFVMARSLAGPIQATTDVIARLAKGSTDTAAISGLAGRKDEVGKLVKSATSLGQSLAERATAARAIAGGDLSVNIEPLSGEDRLGKALAEMVSGLRQLVRSIRDASVSINNGAEQVSQASQSLSSSTTEQAAHMEELNSTMHVIGSQAKSSAEQAASANRLAVEASQAADKGATDMASMVTAMEDITQSSDAIVKIIKVIDEIAFQTNLLALNAAVEAARAGRHGKGFAVVAEEVRNLASRSAKAAQETAELIEGSNAKITLGSEVVKTTAASLETIVENINGSAELVAGIAEASTEQASGIGETTVAMSSLDTSNQSNTASAEETAASAEELNAQAQELQQLVQRFHLGEDGAGPEQTVTVRQAAVQQLPAGGQDGWGEVPGEDNTVGY